MARGRGPESVGDGLAMWKGKVRGLAESVGSLGEAVVRVVPLYRRGAWDQVPTVRVGVRRSFGGIGVRISVVRGWLAGMRLSRAGAAVVVARPAWQVGMTVDRVGGAVMSVARCEVSELAVGSGVERRYYRGVGDDVEELGEVAT